MKIALYPSLGLWFGLKLQKCLCAYQIFTGLSNVYKCLHNARMSDVYKCLCADV